MVLLDQIWLTRNKWRHEKAPFTLTQISLTVKRTAKDHYRAWQRKVFSPQAVHQPFYHRCYRAHFDAAICPDKSAAAVVIFGPDRNIISACTSILPSMTPLCAVAEALLLSVDQVKHLEISEILLEGANSEIIDALAPQISKVMCELEN